MRLLGNLPDWQVYREVAEVLDGDDLVAWRRFYETKPGREVLMREAVRALGMEAKRPHSLAPPLDSRDKRGTGRG